MNKLQQIINYRWFPYVFFIIAIGISVFQHYRIFSLDFIGYHTWRQTQTQTVIQNFAFEDFKLLFPLPQIEMDVNPNLIQNPGY